MSASMLTIAEQVAAYCARIGTDPLLVQGAGGNISWKDGNTLWIKASGTWLADANEKNIFVPVDLADVHAALVEQNFHVVPKLIAHSSLRPSIETLLHALLPHKVVLHVHAVEILAHLVRKNSAESLNQLVGDTVRWGLIDYFKPGAELAAAVAAHLRSHPDTEVVFLQNHGVVIGGENVQQIQAILDGLTSRLRSAVAWPLDRARPARAQAQLQAKGYHPCSDPVVQCLVMDKRECALLQNAWALYPDHVVFLGAQAALINDVQAIQAIGKDGHMPPFVFFAGMGVYENASTTQAQKVQLRCYCDVIFRQTDAEKLAPLSASQVADLLHWDAEKYRRSIEK